jgi:hypothetical protein
MFGDLLEAGDVTLSRIPHPTALAFPHQSTDNSEHTVHDAEDDDDFLPYLSWVLLMRPRTLSTMTTQGHVIKFLGLLAPQSH